MPRRRGRSSPTKKVAAAGGCGLPRGERELVEGDVACFPRGTAGAHQVRNATDEPVRILMLSTLIAPEILEYWGGESWPAEWATAASPARVCSRLWRAFAHMPSRSARKRVTGQAPSVVFEITV